MDPELLKSEDWTTSGHFTSEQTLKSNHYNNANIFVCDCTQIECETKHQCRSCYIKRSKFEFNPSCPLWLLNGSSLTDRKNRKTMLDCNSFSYTIPFCSSTLGIQRHSLIKDLPVSSSTFIFHSQRNIGGVSSSNMIHTSRVEFTCIDDGVVDGDSSWLCSPLALKFKSFMLH